MKKCITCFLAIMLVVVTAYIGRSDKLYEYVYAQSNESVDIVNDDIEEISDNVKYLAPTFDETDWKVGNIVDYPITQSEDEWEDLLSHDDMIKACNVPNEVLADMDTNELINLLYDYPLLIDMYAYDTIEEGIKHLAEECNILGELCKRKDFSIELLKERRNQGSAETYEEFKQKNLIDSLINQKEAAKVESNINNVFGDNLITAFAASSPNLKKILRVDTITMSNGKTTKGTVYKYAGATWASEQNAEYRKTYPLATLVSSADNRYNCHSYAWYKQSPNIYWIFNPSDYIESGLYKSSNAKKGVKIVYTKGEKNYIHSGIVTNANNLTVESKWGTGPVMIHKVRYCPYTSATGYEYHQKK